MSARRPRATSQVDTRERVLQSAIRLFSAHGFEKVTVRDIVRDARANVAAVNYHFDGKLGLYTEVVERAVTLMRSANDETRNVPAGSTAEGRLRHFVRTFMAIGNMSPDAEWIHNLMRWEMERPTPAVRAIVRQVMAPRFRCLCEVIGHIMGADPEDARVRRCMLSVQAQIFFALNMIRVKGRLRAAGFTEVTAMGPEDAADFAEHIVRFSRAGIKLNAPTPHR